MDILLVFKTVNLDDINKEVSVDKKKDWPMLGHSNIKRLEDSGEVGRAKTGKQPARGKENQENVVSW